MNATTDLIYLGQRIKTLREIRGWKQTDLARKSGVSQKTISNAERGGGGRESMSLASLEKIASAFGLTAWQMLLPDDTSYQSPEIRSVLRNYSRATPQRQRAIEMILSE